MRARNRNRRRGGKGSGDPRASRDQGRNKQRGRRKGRGRKGAGFWGDADRLPPAERDVRITEDPSAVPRSLGPPPLPGHEKIAEHYFTAVYDRAVATAGALAAAGGLIGTEELTHELDDETE